MAFIFYKATIADVSYNDYKGRTDIAIDAIIN